MVAIEAAKRGLPRISIRRRKNYLRPLDRQQPDSIYVRLANDDTRETTISGPNRSGAEKPCRPYRCQTGATSPLVSGNPRELFE